MWIRTYPLHIRQHPSIHSIVTISQLCHTTTAKHQISICIAPACNVISHAYRPINYSNCILHAHYVSLPYWQPVYVGSWTFFLHPTVSRWRHSIFGLCVYPCARPWSYTNSLWTWYLINRLWKFQQIYILGAVGIKDKTRCSAIAERPRCSVHYSFS